MYTFIGTLYVFLFLMYVLIDKNYVATDASCWFVNCSIMFTPGSTWPFWVVKRYAQGKFLKGCWKPSKSWFITEWRGSEGRICCKTSKQHVIQLLSRLLSIYNQKISRAHQNYVREFYNWLAYFVYFCRWKFSK